MFQPAGEETDAPDVLVALGPGEACLWKCRTHHIAVQALDACARGEQTLDHLLRDRGFACARKAREPQDGRFRERAGLATQRRIELGKRLEDDAASADVEIVDDHEATRGRTFVDQIERERRIQDERALRDLVPPNLRRGVAR